MKKIYFINIIKFLFLAFGTAQVYNGNGNLGFESIW